MSDGRNAVAAVTAARGGATGNAFWSELRESFRNPEFWALSSWLDIIVRARRSRFGPLWLLAPSLVYVLGLGSFFASAFGRDLWDFAAHIALGAMVFRTLMSSVVESANVFSGSRSFIMDGHVRLTDYLLESLAKAFFNFCMFLPVTVLVLSKSGLVIAEGFLWAPLSLALLYINGLWITVVFSLIGARFTDLGQLLANISIFIFLTTPIIWYADTMPADSLRGQLMRFNPFYHFVTIIRGPILGERVEMLSIYYVGIMTAVGLVLATFLYRRYARFVPLWI